MAGKTKIEWTDASWNPVVGCSIVSPGCTNCYAMKMAHRLQAMAGKPRWTKNLGGTAHYAGTTKVVNGNAVWTGNLALAPERVLTAPLRRKKPMTYFVNSMSDLFHEDCPDEWIDKVFAVMALCPQHTFQVLTKRAERMRDYFAARMTGDPWAEAADEIGDMLGMIDGHPVVLEPEDIPLPNVWLGVSAEDQKRADERIPHLLETPAAVRFISAEPLLGPINLQRISLGTSEATFHGHPEIKYAAFFMDATRGVNSGAIPALDWVIVGGESGPNARPMNPDWVRSLRDQCATAGVPFFFKQYGEWLPIDGPRWSSIDQSRNGTEVWIDRMGKITRDADVRGLTRPSPYGQYILRRVGKKAAGRLLDGIEHNGMPASSKLEGRAA
jgi:protein gp37